MQLLAAATAAVGILRSACARCYSTLSLSPARPRTAPPCFYQLVGQAFRWSKRWQLSRPMPWPPGTPLFSVEVERRQNLGVVCRAGGQARAGRPALFFQYTIPRMKGAGTPPPVREGGSGQWPPVDCKSGRQRLEVADCPLTTARWVWKRGALRELSTWRFAWSHNPEMGAGD